MSCLLSVERSNLTNLIARFDTCSIIRCRRCSGRASAYFGLLFWNRASFCWSCCGVSCDCELSPLAAAAAAAAVAAAVDAEVVALFRFLTVVEDDLEVDEVDGDVVCDFVEGGGLNILAGNTATSGTALEPLLTFSFHPVHLSLILR